jgi:hypothetical protein
MKCAALVLWASLVFAYSAAAQGVQLAAGGPELRGVVVGSAGSLTPASDFLLDSPTSELAMGFTSASPAAPTLAEAVPEAIAVAVPASSVHQPVYGVLQDFNFQAYGGFTYFRFYELPGITGNLAGFNVSLVYYPHAGHLGVDGEFAVGFASQSGANTTLDAGLGGGRFRVIGPRHIEVWAHALAGGAHFVPMTPYGSESALAFEAGGGIDWAPPRAERISFRVQADVLATYFFSTHQYTPKISAGIVYKF